MKKNILILFRSTLIFTACFLIVLSVEVSTQPRSVDAQSTVTTSSTPSAVTRLSDYAWSENIGWISFKDGAKPVIVGADGSLTGFAWSENIGWVQFGGLSGFPDTSNGTNAMIVGNKITGWARVISGVAPASAALDNRGGFDGWISLSGSNYGVTVNGATLGGYAWGGDVVGWIDFSGVTIQKLLNACQGPYGTNIPDGQNFTYYSAPDSTGSCNSEVRTCSNGSLSGSYTEISCGDTSSCVRGGRSFNAGDKVTFYAKSIAGQCETCSSFKAELTCKDGKFVDDAGNADNVDISLNCINNPSYIER